MGVGWVWAGCRRLGAGAWVQALGRRRLGAGACLRALGCGRFLDGRKHADEEFFGAGMMLRGKSFPARSVGASPCWTCHML